jgi:MFS family permease
MGWLSDRFGRDPAMGVCAITGIAGYALYVVGSGFASIVVATALVGVGMSWGATMLPKFLDHMTDAEEGLGFGLVRTTYMVFGASGSVGTGILADSLGWGRAFYVLAGILAVVLGGLLAAGVRRRL